MATTTPTSKPTIVLVPGAWHTIAGYETLRTQLEAKGFPTEAVPLLSVGAEPPVPSLNEDAISLRSTLERLSDEGKAIVLVTHSYSGVVASNATEGLGFTQRAKVGKKGGVIMLVYMTAFAIPKGKCLLDMLGGNYLPWMKVDGEYCHSSDEANVFYHDLPDSAQQHWISQLKHTSTSVYSGKATYEPWLDIPCMFIVCEDDRAVPVQIQDAMVASLGDVLTFRIKSSHSPFLSSPEKVVEALELAAKTGLEKAA